MALPLSDDQVWQLNADLQDARKQQSIWTLRVEYLSTLITASGEARLAAERKAANG